MDEGDSQASPPPSIELPDSQTDAEEPENPFNEDETTPLRIAVECDTSSARTTGRNGQESVEHNSYSRIEEFVTRKGKLRSVVEDDASPYQRSFEERIFRGPRSALLQEKKEEPQTREEIFPSGASVVEDATAPDAHDVDTELQDLEPAVDAAQLVQDGSAAIAPTSFFGSSATRLTPGRETLGSAPLVSNMNDTSWNASEWLSLLPRAFRAIQPFFDAAGNVEKRSARVAYLCELHALEEGLKLRNQANARGRGGLHFLTRLLARLESRDASTRHELVVEDMDDFELMERFTMKYFYEIRNKEKRNRTDPSLGALFRTCGVLFEVLSGLAGTPSDESTPQRLSRTALAAAEYCVTAAEKRGTKQFNLVQTQAPSTALLPEVDAAVKAFRKAAHMLPDPIDGWAGYQANERDILTWCELTFGFQASSVDNVREQLILLLANGSRGSNSSEQAVTGIWTKFFRNYHQWCRHLKVAPRLEDDEVLMRTVKNRRAGNARVSRALHQWRSSDYRTARMLLSLVLYMCAWGEAANIRHMPECLCFIYHNLASELEEQLANSSVRAKCTPFISKVVKPFYGLQHREAQIGLQARAHYTSWCNYDDLNELFWSRACLKVEWPPAIESRTLMTRRGGTVVVGKTVLEKRSWLTVLLVYDRVALTHALLLQLVVILATQEFRGKLYTSETWQWLSSVGVTMALLKVLKSVVGFWSVIGLRQLSFFEIFLGTFRFACRVFFALVLATYFWKYQIRVVEDPWCPPLYEEIQDWFPDGPDPYLLALIIYFIPSVVQAFVAVVAPGMLNAIEKSRSIAVRWLTLWSVPNSFVGRGLYVDRGSFLSYTLLWLGIFAAKAVYSYYLLFKPMISFTVDLYEADLDYSWSEFSPNSEQNWVAIILSWLPRVLAFFYDTILWYIACTSLLSFFLGVALRVGEIQDWSWFRAQLASRHNQLQARCAAVEGNDVHDVELSSIKIAHSNDSETDLSQPSSPNDTELEPRHKGNTGYAQFVATWNETISSMREEDLISNVELEALQIPVGTRIASQVAKLESIKQYPLLLVAGRLFKTISWVASNPEVSDEAISRKLAPESLDLMSVRDAYWCLKYILFSFVIGPDEQQFLKLVFDLVDSSIKHKTLSKNFVLARLPELVRLVKALLYALQGSGSQRNLEVARVESACQALYDFIVFDFISQQKEDTLRQLLYNDALLFSKREVFRMGRVRVFDTIVDRLLALLTTTSISDAEPRNAEARRRLFFFLNSLHMKVPAAPCVRDMVSFSVLTPYYNEDVIYSAQQLTTPNEDGISTLFYLQKVYPDEWRNFLERLGVETESSAWDVDGGLALRLWASYRGQTLARTVRGMMYYGRALKMQAMFDVEGPMRNGSDSCVDSFRNMEPVLRKEVEDIVLTKFVHVCTCQIYGKQKQSGDFRARDISLLMHHYDFLRVAYVDEVEESISLPSAFPTTTSRLAGVSKRYYSVLLKGNPHGAEEEVYRVELPGPPILGEGKPENQNHAIVFTRGEVVQVIDMNQDGYFEEASKVRNLLQEFSPSVNESPPAILGVREHIFTGSVSSTANFFSLQESAFVSMVQRVMANPLQVRMHYGHPDFFDRIRVVTLGGVSKASRTLNLSEDVFGGYNHVLRGGKVQMREYMQVGKGRDVGLNSCAKFEAKVASGNAEQVLSRDVRRLAHRFDLFRHHSFFFSANGFYLSTVLLVVSVFVFAYGNLYMVFAGIDGELDGFGEDSSLRLWILNLEFLLQLGFASILPLLLQFVLEVGVYNAFIELIRLWIQLGPLFFGFLLGVKAYFTERTLSFGGAKYMSTGRGFVVMHERFAEYYRAYAYPVFYKAFELVVILSFTAAYKDSSGLRYWLATFSIWILLLAWFLSPFLFNPSGFEWLKILNDFKEWKAWIDRESTVGSGAKASWRAWWQEENEYLCRGGVMGRLWRLILSLRLFFFQFGVSFNLTTDYGKDGKAYLWTWAATVGIVLLVWLSTFFNFSRISRIGKAIFVLFCVGAIAIVIVLSEIFVSFGDVVALFVSIGMSIWGLVQVAVAVEPIVPRVFMRPIVPLARAQDLILGFLMFVPLAVLSFFPFTNDLQTRLLFNQAFSRGLQISLLLQGAPKQD